MRRTAREAQSGEGAGSLWNTLGKGFGDGRPINGSGNGYGDADRYGDASGDGVAGAVVHYEELPE